MGFDKISSKTYNSYDMGFYDFVEKYKLSDEKKTKDVQIKLDMSIYYQIESKNFALHKPTLKGDSFKDSFAKILSTGSCSDILLVCGEENFPCHKSILAARSDVFETMFKHTEFKENKEGIIEINDMEVKIMKLMLKFIYTNDLETEIPEELIDLL